MPPTTDRGQHSADTMVARAGSPTSAATSAIMGPVITPAIYDRAHSQRMRSWT
jgi:hypothetical protein